MAGFDFFARGSPPRKTSFWTHFRAVIAMALGHIPWIFNIVRVHRFWVTGLVIPGGVVFLFGALLPSVCSVAQLDSVTPSNFLFLLHDRIVAAPIVDFLITSLQDQEVVRSLLILMMLYPTVRILQHWSDYRAWHTPWAPAHADRVLARPNFPGARDFPCMIVGVGGSGKSTLAEILEKSYVDRQLIKLRNADEIGEERTRISRDVGETGVGRAQQAYTITWAPGRFQVGRMAEAYDLPGQIVEDWSRAFHQMTGKRGSRPRRIAIFHVVSNGYNANIRKFEPVAAKCTPDEFLTMISEGKIPIERDPNKDKSFKVKDGYCSEYTRYYREREIEKFAEFVEASVKLKRNEEMKTKPLEILLVHVIGMASHWAEFEPVAENEKEVRLTPNCCDALAFYAKQFSDIHKQLSAIPNVSLTVGYLPASLQFGDMTVEHEGKSIKIFGLAKPHVGEYEEKSRYNVMVHSALALATVKTVRALRLALHAKPERWFHREINTKRPAHDLFDRWTEHSTDGSALC